jgi:hypothetical protein
VSGSGFLAYLLALSTSFFLHGLLFLILFFLIAAPISAVPTEITAGQEKEAVVEPEKQADPVTNDPLTAQDIDPAALDPNVDINFDSDRLASVTAPGIVNVNEPVGIEGASLSAPPMNLPAPGGFGIGQGGAIEIPGMTGNVDLAGAAGGYSLQGAALPGSFNGRSGATKEKALIDGGGTRESEAAVAKGLNWLLRVQHPDGAWRLEGPFRDPAQSGNDIAGTAFGLLPFLGAGKTHKSGKDNPFDKPIERALLFLLRKQDRQNGYFGGGMYGHSLATIAICEAYGLTKDPALRYPAQKALHYLIAGQHAGGGWRYGPNEAGDTSVTGWAVMAVKSGRMAGLDVPDICFQKAIRYLNNSRNSQNEGYGYVGTGATYTMSAVGLLCRQYLQNWNRNTPQLVKGIENHLKTLPPGKTRNMYYYYYATQVMHHFTDGEEWQAWNNAMRNDLVKRQGPDGSWDPRGDAHASAGGRLMETSLCLLTLEVYYRHLPLYYREQGEKKQRLLMGQ